VSADAIRVRPAREGDTEAIVAIVNDAYRVEAFFVGGDRTNPGEVRMLIEAGEFLVAEEADRIVGCVQVAVRNGRGYFGMLAVPTTAQGRGIGRRLIAEAEQVARNAACPAMDIKVVNLRTDLVPLYDSLGYVATGTEPYVHRPVIQPCHFVTMTKRL
jgi:ribosomal protein S18 acetylase RimI-like enzyme